MALGAVVAPGVAGVVSRVTATISGWLITEGEPMDTREVAQRIGTDPKTLRQFLRSPASTFTAVGSNSRYDFNERDVETLRSRFQTWTAGRGKIVSRVPVPPTPVARNVQTPFNKDQAVWDSEPPIMLPDIRIPAVRRAVRDKAAAQIRRLDEQLIAVGLHITQRRDHA